MKTKNRLLTTMTALLAGLAVAGCSPAGSNKNTLNVIALNLGYGREWIDEAVKVWEEENPDYKINLNASPDARSLVTSSMSKSNSDDDVYISNGTDWRRYAGQGKLLELDDLLQETVDGIKVIDKINPEYAQSIYFERPNAGKHTYRLPWMSDVGGIFYNAKMFEDNGWAVPTTTDELLALCQNIVDNPVYVDPLDPTSPRVYPFAYTGENTDYFDYLVYTWWGQIVGADAINEFKNYGREDSGKFNATTNATYAGLKQATDVWYQIFGNAAYSDPEDVTRDNHTAQKNFMQGKAAMMISGNWLYNEMLNYNTNHNLPSNFVLKIMDSPKIVPTAESCSYVIGEDQYIAVPATTKKADLAKSFIKTLISDKVLKIFFEKAHGMMAYKLSSGTYQTTNTYMQSLMDYRAHLTKTFTNYSSSPLFLNNFVDFWGASSGRPFLQLIKKTYHNIDEAFTEIYNNVERQWGTWVSESRM